MTDTTVIVRYIVSDVQKSTDWYVNHFGFSVFPTPRRPSRRWNAGPSDCC
jgi:catechol 2,3-dioxygenase-like lactoylglutathione lyase family enzyme